MQIPGVMFHAHAFCSIMVNGAASQSRAWSQRRVDLAELVPALASANAQVHQLCNDMHGEHKQCDQAINCLQQLQGRSAGQSAWAWGKEWAGLGRAGTDIRKHH